MTTTLPAQESVVDRVFGVFIQEQSYKNALYLLCSFPLGLLYFVSTVVLFNLGAGLAIIVIGFGVWLLAFALSAVFVRVERRLASGLLGASFHREPIPYWMPGNFLQALGAKITRRETWKAELFLLLRFPLGIVSLVSILLLTAPLALIFTPLFYNLFPTYIGFHRIIDPREAFLLSAIGILLGLVILHIINGLAGITRRLAEALL